MKRRTFITAAAAWLATEPSARAQSATGARPRIGVVHLSATAEAPVVVGLKQGLRDLGYVEGRDVVLDIRAARNDKTLAVAAVGELVKAQAHVIVSAGTIATTAAQLAAAQVPVVFTQVGEPIAAGFVKTLQRPGGNMTGFTHLLSDTSGKRLEILKELVPACRTVLVIYDPSNPTSRQSVTVARNATKRLGLVLRERHVAVQSDVLGAIAGVERSTSDALLVIPDSLVANAGEHIVAMSRQKRVPVMFHEATWVERGGLASYGASFVDLGRRAAAYVDKIVKGAKAGDLPVEQPTKFELVLNRGTAKALGIAIPHSLILRAAKVVE